MKDLQTEIDYFLEDIGGELYPDYSGRNMYGRECIGFTVECSPDMVRGFLEQWLEDFDSIDFLKPEKMRSDSMGKGYIVYWPDLSL